MMVSNRPLSFSSCRFVSLFLAYCGLHVASGFYAATTSKRITSILSTLGGDCVSTRFADWLESGRQIGNLKEWSVERRIRIAEGMELAESNTSIDDEDCCVRFSALGNEDMLVLEVPRDLIFSWTEIRQTVQEVPGFEAALRHLEERNCQDQQAQFFLWLKVLQEFEKGGNSKWYEWLNSLPRRFENSLYYDDIEMECLSPYAWSLAKLALLNLEAFRESLDLMPDVTQPETRKDNELCKWALSVVFTRCWGEEGSGSSDDCHIVPVGDMLNHGCPSNTYISYDDEGNCQLKLKEDIPAGSPLSLSYGSPFIPSRFLVLYGFVDEDQPEIFSQVLVSNPSQKHIDLGYDTSKMVFSARDGSIAREVVDVTLFSILEQVPEVQQKFYDAATGDDVNTYKMIRQQFLLETCIVLKKHVDGRLEELLNLLRAIDAREADKHIHLSLIRKHNAFLFSVFSKANARLDEIGAAEAKRRKQNRPKDG